MTFISCIHSSPSERQLAQARSIQRDGEIFLYRQEYTAALVRLMEADKILPNDPALLNSLGLAYLGKEKNELARKTFKKILKIQPDYLEAMNNLGASYLRMEKWDKAIDICLPLSQNLAYPTPHFALANIGRAYLGKKEYARAQKSFEQALALEPDFSAAHHGIIQVLLKTGRINTALSHVNYCLKQFPETAIFHADQGELHEFMGEPAKAQRAWQTVTRLASPKSKLAARARKRLFQLGNEQIR